MTKSTRGSQEYLKSLSEADFSDDESDFGLDDAIDDLQERIDSVETSITADSILYTRFVQQIKSDIERMRRMRRSSVIPGLPSGGFLDSKVMTESDLLEGTEAVTAVLDDPLNTKAVMRLREFEKKVAVIDDSTRLVQNLRILLGVAALAAIIAAAAFCPALIPVFALLAHAFVFTLVPAISGFTTSLAVSEVIGNAVAGIITSLALNALSNRWANQAYDTVLRTLEENIVYAESDLDASGGLSVDQRSKLIALAKRLIAEFDALKRVGDPSVSTREMTYVYNLLNNALAGDQQAINQLQSLTANSICVETTLDKLGKAFYVAFPVTLLVVIVSMALNPIAARVLSGVWYFMGGCVLGIGAVSAATQTVVFEAAAKITDLGIELSKKTPDTAVRENLFKTMNLGLFQTDSSSTTRESMEVNHPEKINNNQ